MTKIIKTITISILLSASLAGCSSPIADAEASVEVEKTSGESNITVVEVDPDSELGEQITKMDEHVYGEGNKYQIPVLINEEDLVGSWKISKALIEFYPNGRFQYFMTTEKNPIRCQIGSYSYINSEQDQNSDQEYSMFTLNIEHMIIDEIATEFENVVPYVITGLKEENDFGVLNMNSYQVSEFSRVSGELNDSLLNIEDFELVTMEEFQKAFEGLE